MSGSAYDSVGKIRESRFPFCSPEHRESILTTHFLAANAHTPRKRRGSLAAQMSPCSASPLNNQPDLPESARNLSAVYWPECWPHPVGAPCSHWCPSEWTVLSLFSFPWPFILYRRAQRAREKGDSSTGVTIRYIGAGLLVFLAFGLIILGSILAVSGILNPSPSSHASAFDRAASFIGCVLATLGIGLAVFLCRRTGQLQVSKIVEELIGLLLAFLTLMLIPMIWTGTFEIL